jgi:hypothetical protein
MAKNTLNSLLPIRSSFAEQSWTLGDILAEVPARRNGLLGLLPRPEPAPTLGDLLAGHAAQSQGIGLLALPNPPAPATGGGLFGLGDAPLTRPAWSFCERRFRRFMANVEPMPKQQKDVATTAVRIVECLNRKFWGGPPGEGIQTAILAGSWGKGTPARLSSDMDIVFLLPWSMYHRYEGRQGNKQSDILQEVKNALLPTYWNTDIKGDGPAVVLRFSNYKIEVVPSFLERDFAIGDPAVVVLTCNTRDGGMYRRSAPIAERAQIDSHDSRWNGDLRALICMAKTWKRHCTVPIGSYLIDQLAIEFLSGWANAGKGAFWYDWMMRDFFNFMLTRQHGWGLLPVSNALFVYGDAWASKAATAARNATNAWIYEQKDLNVAAGEAWQKIFGSLIPPEV